MSGATAHDGKVPLCLGLGHGAAGEASPQEGKGKGRAGESPSFLTGGALTEGASRCQRGR